MADDEEPTPLDREEVISLIAKHARRLATLASEQGCTTLSYMLQVAARRAERELA